MVSINVCWDEPGWSRSFGDGEYREPEFGAPIGDQVEVFGFVGDGASLSAFGQPGRVTLLFERPVDPFDRDADLHGSLLRIERITAGVDSFREDDFGLRTRAEGVVPRSGGFDAPTFEFGVGRDLSVHVGIDGRVFGFPLGYGVGEDQRAPLDVDALPGEGRYDGLHAEMQPDAVSVPELAPDGYEGSFRALALPGFPVDADRGVVAPAGDAQLEGYFGLSLHREYEFDLPVEGIGGALLDAELQRFFYAIGIPMFQVFESCKHFIRTIPALVYDEAKPEDIDTDGEDHIYDECRYLLMQHPISPREHIPYNRPAFDPLDLGQNDQRRAPASVAIKIR